MAWSYSAYVGANVGISIALIVITIVTVLLLPYSSKSFLIERIFGIYLKRNDQESMTVVIYDITLDKAKLEYSKIEWMFVIITGIILSLMPVLLFNGLILSTETLSLGELCPMYPMDCFVFPHRTLISSPTASFSCQPGYSSNLSDSIGEFAWCYGWVIGRQSSINVLNQLGLCSGLIGLFATLFAFTFHVGHRKVGLAIVFTIIVCLMIGLILLAVFKLSLSFITFATLFLCALMGAFGLFLKRVVIRQPKPVYTDNQLQAQRRWPIIENDQSTTSKNLDSVNFLRF